LLTDRWFTHGILSEVDDLFRRLEPRGLDGRHGLTHATQRARPLLDVTEADGAFVITADVPGLAPERLELSFEDDVLTLKGHVDAEPEEGWRALRVERPSLGGFERKLRFGRPVDADGIEARLADGVLRVTVPLRTPTARTIPVRVA
jgi:HSP20 family protein